MVDTSEPQAAQTIRNLTKLSRNLGELEVPRETATAVALGLGWWMRSIRTAGAVRLLHKNGLSQEASPLLRTLLIHAAAIEWLRQFPNAALEAVRYEHEDYRQKLYQKAHMRRWDLTGVDLGPPPSGEKPDGLVLLREVEKLCTRIGSEHLYVAYKIESPYSHPSALSADSYFDPPLEDSGMPQLRDHPSVAAVPLRVAATFALCATNSLGQLGRLSRLTDESNRLADRLGVTDQLTGNPG
jgi:hypothetical protein